MENRNRFLNTVLKNDRLNVAIDVWVSVLCDMPDATVSPRLATPPRFINFKYYKSQYCSGSGDLLFPRVTFVSDKALHSGFFMLHRRWIDRVYSLALRHFLFDNNTDTGYAYACFLLS